MGAGLGEDCLQVVLQGVFGDLESARCRPRVVAGGEPSEHVGFPAGEAVGSGEQVGTVQRAAVLDGDGDVLGLGRVMIFEARGTQH